MRKNIIRGALLAVLLLGFAIPGAALAGNGGKGCSNIGTWFGVSPTFPPPLPGTPLDPPSEWPARYLAGYSATVAGKSSNEGTNHFEYPVFDPKLTLLGLDQTPPFSMADRIGSMRGNWKRTGGNTFDYTFMGFAFNTEGMPVYIAKISGQVELILDCQYQKTTAVMEVFTPDMSPFDHDPLFTIALGEFYGFRAKVVPPSPPTFP
jgi:hypothetical protein